MKIILAIKVLALIAACTSCVCLAQVTDPFGDPVLGTHTVADTELLLGAIHSRWSQEKHAILAGANPNIRDKGGEPLLSWHLRTDQTIDHLRFLIDHGADVNVRESKHGITPLMLVSNPELIALLVSAGAKLEAKDSEGLTPLFHALKRWAKLANSGLSESIINSIVERLLDKGADPNTRNLQGENALFYFVRMGHEYHTDCLGCPELDPIVIVRALAKAGVDLNGTAPIKGYAAPATLLGYSAFNYPDVTMLKALLATGTHPDDLISNQPFFHNVEQRCPECAAYVKQAYPTAPPFTPRRQVLVPHTVTGSLDVPAGQANGSSDPDCPPAKCGEVIVHGIGPETPTSGYACCDIRVFVAGPGTNYECTKQPPDVEDNAVEWWDCGPNYARFDGPYMLDVDPSGDGKTGRVRVRFRNWRSVGQTATVLVTYSVASPE